MEGKDWFHIYLDDPRPILLTRPSQDPQQIRGNVMVILTKPTRVRSFDLRFTGLASASFAFDTSSIDNAAPCTPSGTLRVAFAVGHGCVASSGMDVLTDNPSHHPSITLDKFSFGSFLMVQPLAIFGESRDQHLIPAGTHSFPFQFSLDSTLPASTVCPSLYIHYQVVASLQLQSFLSMTQTYKVAHPVKILRPSPLPPSRFCCPMALQFASAQTTRLLAKVTHTSNVFSQKATLPIVLTMALQGHTTTIAKVSLELWESLQGPSSSSSTDRAPLDERLVTRQNCPLQGLPSSTLHQTSSLVLSRRLLFKVPALIPWDDPASSTDLVTLSSIRPNGPGKGFCHPSGPVHGLEGFLIVHSFRVTIELEGTVEVTAPNGGLVQAFEQDQAHVQTEIWIQGPHQEQGPVEDESHPPTYDRCFATPLVQGEQLAEMDRRSLEALQERLPEDPSSSLPPPDYQDTQSMEEHSLSPAISPASTSASSLPLTYSTPRSLSQSTGADDEGEEAYRLSLAAYTQRHSTTFLSMWASPQVSVCSSGPSA